MLCEIWGEVLRRESVGIHDNFFSIGGDSILSIRIVSELKKLGWFLAVQDIFVHQTISKLAEKISEHGSNENEQINTEIAGKIMMSDKDELIKGEVETEI
ncbi:phosphopantetheine-binding protein [Pleionea litopenaei]|nr:phosphopantetheine-binding protein [Pleionea sp. HL-JVS1]WMS89281.1 phosphopantetheine-binding protein [Pleionea sp. HL-JVS1]